MVYVRPIIVDDVTEADAAFFNNVLDGIDENSPMVERAYAEVSSKVPMDTSGTFTTVPQLSITFATGARPAMVEGYLSGIYGNGEATWGFRVVRVSDGAVMAEGVTNTSASVGYPPAPVLRFRLPANTPTATYVIQTNRWAGSATGEFNTQERKAFLSAVSM